MRRLSVALSATLLALVLIAAPAVASSGTASCGGGANGWTGTGQTGLKTHTFSGHAVQVTGPTQVLHGWYTGSRAWSVTPNLGSGWCVE